MGSSPTGCMCNLPIKKRRRYFERPQLLFALSLLLLQLKYGWILLANILILYLPFRIWLYQTSMTQLQDSLIAIRGGRIPPPGSMPSFEEIKEILGFNTYYEEEKRYATSVNQLSSQRGEREISEPTRDAI